MAGMTYQDLSTEWMSTAESMSVHTSGSTGAPKHISLPKSMLRRSALRTIEFFNLSHQSLLHSCIAPDYIGGKMMFIRAQVCGCRFTYETPTNRPLLGPYSRMITLASVVPSQMRWLLSHPKVAGHAGIYLVGGSNLPPGMAQEIEKTGIVAYESYGMTETASHIALRRISASPTPFTPLPGIKLGKDSRGCLIIDLGPDGVVHTNDIVSFHDSDFFQFRIEGRADQMIISGGIKINPVEIENLAIEMLGGRLCAAVSRPDPIWGEKVVLLVEGDEPLDTAMLSKAMAEHLDHYKLPKEILRVSRLPRTPNGKILRKDI